MTRRAWARALAAIGSAHLAYGQMDDDFTRAVNRFIVAWNAVSSAIASGRWDVKAAAACEAAFQELTEHPAWIRMGRKK